MAVFVNRIRKSYWRHVPNARKTNQNALGIQGELTNLDN